MDATTESQSPFGAFLHVRLLGRRVYHELPTLETISALEHLSNRQTEEPFRGPPSVEIEGRRCVLGPECRGPQGHRPSRKIA
jgi:hypothetical protein